MTYERESLRKIHGYTPGKQPAATAKVVKLNTNENPYPPCAAVMGALTRVPAEALRRYPPPFADGFRAVAARLHGLAPEQVMAVNGGDELLRLAISTFVEPGQPLGVFEPSYSLYPVLAALHGSPVHNLPLQDDWSLPARAAEQLNAAGVPLTFVVNPHAPSGALTSVEALSELAGALEGVLLVDEAYVDFVDPERAYDATELVRRHSNVLLLRTLSKGYSLAGLRFGYALGDAGLITPMLTKTRDSYNVDAVAQQLAQAALEHRAEAAETWRKVREERSRVSDALTTLSFQVAPSQSNFLLAAVPPAFGDAGSLERSLEARNVLVRYFDQPRLRDKLRITIGTAEENDALVNALRETRVGNSNAVRKV
jgi:histidinol-phosphate aminotransferase